MSLAGLYGLPAGDHAVLDGPWHGIIRARVPAPTPAEERAAWQCFADGLDADLLELQRDLHSRREQLLDDMTENLTGLA